MNGFVTIKWVKDYFPWYNDTGLPRSPCSLAMTQFRPVCFTVFIKSASWPVSRVL